MPLVRVDFQLFQQALANLLLNASIYTAPKTQIEVGARVVAREIELTVSDNGPGLPQEAIPHLFDMFYRVQGSKTGGAGIGLAITKVVVEVHGGTVTASNIPTGGACFTIILPLEMQPQLPADRSEL
jgi:two-component system sensor histidine kinase KdpD